MYASFNHLGEPIYFAVFIRRHCIVIRFFLILFLPFVSKNFNKI